MQHSFALRSPPRRPYSNVKSMVLVAQFGATAVLGTRQEREGATRRGRFIGVEALDCTPLPHNEMLARTLLSFELWINNAIDQTPDQRQSQDQPAELPKPEVLSVRRSSGIDRKADPIALRSCAENLPSYLDRGCVRDSLSLGTGEECHSGSEPPGSKMSP